MAFSGAEPIRGETLDRFATTFESCGFRREAFYPCYGMAETTLLVSGILKTALPKIYQVEKAALEQHRVVVSPDKEGTQTIVGCGQTWLEQKIVIVNSETLRQCSEQQVGEIWVSGQNVTQGYWNRPTETEQTFHAYIADTNEGPFLRTGDLGFLQDGELFIMGRLKDLIIIHGLNHYPQDIELTVEQSHPRLMNGSSAAFSVTINGEEQLVIAAEVERRYGPKSDRRSSSEPSSGLNRRSGSDRRQVDLVPRFEQKFSQPFNVEETISTIRKTVSEQHELLVYAVLLLRVASIPKTSSGKIQRHACREGFLSGSNLNIVGEWRHDLPNSSKSEVQPQKNKELQHRTAETIQNWLLNKISEQLKIPATEIDIREPLASYGLNSVIAVSLSGEIETWLGRQISPTLVYDYPSIQAMTQHLTTEQPRLKTAAHIDTADKAAIAIIGIGCRFPGGVKDVHAFWQLLHDGVDAITQVPASRWDSNAFYDPNLGTLGKMNNRWGGFLDNDVAGFDPQFFGISPREAKSMDPQQRLLLEVSWEALENAGLAVEQLAGSQTGVFIGISSNDYSRLQSTTNLNAYYGTGNALCIAANRLSYLLDLHGPSWAVDTACSSSLVAVHQACQSLRQGESELALAGGVNLILSPDLSISFSQAQMLSPDGRCKTFDADANGYVRGEGCGVIVLKRVSDALRDQDNILAVIKGTAVNQDGRSNGLTAPNGLAQQAVISQALANAGVKASEISYVEAQGTGTPLGDSIEFNTLKEVLMLDRSPEQFCDIGSVKTNIGHLEAASGMASLIKVVLALQHQEIPAHLHLNKLNPHLGITAEMPLSIPTKLKAWTSEQKLAGVNTFGFGGTNAHLVLASAPESSTEVAKIERPKHLLSLSAKNEPALRALANAYVSYLQSPVQIANLCFTANTGRSHFAHRLAIVADSAEQVQEQLSAFAVGGETVGLVSGKAQSGQSPKIAFLFTDQGSQYVYMGGQLYDTQPIFRQTLNDCAKILRPYLEKPLFEVLDYVPEVLGGNSALIDETVYTQPALFALEYALAKLWQSWGIQASIVMGHGVGEYVAACVAGVFSLEDGLKLIVARGRLMQMMEPMLAEFERVAAEITYAKPQIPLCSNVTGQLVTDEIATPAYWCRHVRQPVRFAASIETLHQQGYEIFVEIGPKPALSDMGRQCLPKGTWLASLRQGQDDWQNLLQSLGELYVHGVPIDWVGFDKDYPRSRLQLPTYPFQRQRYWIDTKPKFDFNLENTKQLIQQLKQSEQLSEDEIKLLPRLFDILAKQSQQQVTTDTVKSIEIRRLLNEAPFEEYDKILTNFIKTDLAHVLNTNSSELDAEQPLYTMGFDSIMAVELRNRLRSELDVEIPIEKLMAGINIIELVQYIKSKTQASDSSIEWEEIDL